MHTVYTIDMIDDEGYKSDFIVNTQNSEGTYQFNTNSTVIDATDNANSNEEILEGSQYNLNNNAAAATNRKHGILRGILRGKGQQRQQFKSTEMP